MATYDLREAVNLSAVEWSVDEDEFAKSWGHADCVIDAPCPLERPGTF